MKVLLKKKNEYSIAYWVERRSKCIMAWSQSNHWDRAFVDSCDYFEPHFIYPENGEYHLSIKYKKDGIERFETTYADKVVAKITYPRDSELPSIRNPESDQISLLIPPMKCCSLLDYQSKAEFFSFPSSGFNLIDYDVPAIKRLFHKRSSPRDDDIVIDVESFKNCSINICCGIRGKGQVSYQTAKHGEIIYRKLDSTKFPIIELMVIISNMDK